MATTQQRGTKRPAEDAEKPKRARRRLRGSLESLPNMPVDILIEIMMYLTSPDILHLARTTKTFRAFLMSRTANYIWRAARMNVPELPDCPEHLSEPAYAHLAYDTFCHECLKPNVTTVFWALGVRYCPSCRVKLLDKCMCSSYACSLVNGSIATFSYDRSKNSRKNHWHLLYDSNHARIKFQLLNEEEKVHHAERIYEITKWARKCEAWQSGIATSRENDINERRSRRLHAVVAKLSELGWADELAHMAPKYALLSEHASVREAKDLTDRIWQNIKDVVVAYMETIRRQRIERERKILLKRRCEIFGQVYRNWYKTQSDKALLPRPVDLIFRCEELRELIGKPDDITVSAEDFEPLAARDFTAWAQMWAEDCKRQLRQMIYDAPEFKDKIPDGVDPLSLASAAFSCKGCENRSVFSYEKASVPALFPDVLQHECLWPASFCMDDPVQCAAVEASTKREATQMHGPWTSGMLRIGRSHQWLAEVIETCGQDPMTVTREEMDALDPRLHCATCEDGQIWKTRRIFVWSNTLAHHCYHATVDSLDEFIDARFRPAWRMVTEPDELELARKLGDRVEEQWDDDNNFAANVEGYHCYYCSSGAMSCFEIMLHLSHKHDLDIDDIHPGDYYLAPGSLFALERAVVLHAPSVLELSMLDKTQLKAIELGTAGIYDYDSCKRTKPEHTE